MPITAPINIKKPPNFLFRLSLFVSSLLGKVSTGKNVKRLLFSLLLRFNWRDDSMKRPIKNVIKLKNWKNLIIISIIFVHTHNDLISRRGCLRSVWFICSASYSSDLTAPWTGYLNFIFASSSGWPIAFETLRKKSDVSSISKTILVDWHSGQTALSIYSLFPEPGDLKKTCTIPNCAVMYALIASWVSSSENLPFGTPDTANNLRAKLPRWLHFEHRTGLSEPNFGIFIVATVSSSLSALISIAFFIAYLCAMLCLLSGRTLSFSSSQF